MDEKCFLEPFKANNPPLKEHLYGSCIWRRNPFDSYKSYLKIISITGEHRDTNDTETVVGFLRIN